VPGGPNSVLVIRKAFRYFTTRNTGIGRHQLHRFGPADGRRTVLAESRETVGGVGKVIGEDLQCDVALQS
jgi:hypothetical protein